MEEDMLRLVSANIIGREWIVCNYCNLFIVQQHTRHYAAQEQQQQLVDSTYRAHESWDFQSLVVFFSG